MQTIAGSVACFEESTVLLFSPTKKDALQNLRRLYGETFKGPSLVRRLLRNEWALAISCCPSLPQNLRRDLRPVSCTCGETYDDTRGKCCDFSHQLVRRDLRIPCHDFCSPTPATRLATPSQVLSPLLQKSLFILCSDRAAALPFVPRSAVPSPLAAGRRRPRCRSCPHLPPSPLPPLALHQTPPPVFPCCLADEHWCVCDRDVTAACASGRAAPS